METTKIKKALARLGLSEEAIERACALIAAAKRAQREAPIAMQAPIAMKESALITRQSGSVIMPTQPRSKTGALPKKRRLVIRYKRGVPGGRTVADEIDALRTRLQRDNIPVWQRPRLQNRLDVLLRAHATGPELASATLAQIESQGKVRKRRAATAQPQGLGKIAAVTLARLGR